MEIYIVMQNVKVNDCFGWHDNGTRPLSAHRSFDVAFDTIFKKYYSIRKQKTFQMWIIKTAMKLVLSILLQTLCLELNTNSNSGLTLLN